MRCILRPLFRFKTKPIQVCNVCSGISCPEHCHCKALSFLGPCEISLLILYPVLWLLTELHTLLASKPINTILRLLFTISLSDSCPSILESCMPDLHTLSSCPELALLFFVCHNYKNVPCKHPVQGGMVNFLYFWSDEALTSLVTLLLKIWR